MKYNTHLLLLSNFILLAIGIIIGLGCESKENQVLTEVGKTFDHYKACISEEDMACAIQLFDSATLAYYESIHQAARSPSEDELERFIRSMPLKRLSTIYTYFLFNWYNSQDAQDASLATSLLAMNAYDILGHNFTGWELGTMDRFDDQRVWAFAVRRDALAGNQKRRLELVRESGDLKFAWIYRNSLADTRLYGAKYDPHSIKNIVNDLFKYNDESSKIQFEAMVDVMAL